MNMPEQHVLLVKIKRTIILTYIWSVYYNYLSIKLGIEAQLYGIWENCDNIESHLQKFYIDSIDDKMIMAKLTLLCRHGSESKHTTGYTMLLRRWINVNDVDSTSQQRRVPSWLHLHGDNIWLLDKSFLVFFCAAHWAHADDHDEDHEDSGDQNTNDKPGLQNWRKRQIRIIKK